MAINLTASLGQTNEQDLVQDLVEEAIEQRGFTARYIVRDMINPDELLGESTISEFTEFYPMPMFLESMEHFNGSGDLYDSFGMAYNDAAIYQVGVRKFKQTLNDPQLPRPREGDLIFLPFSDSLWEVTKVKKDQQYYQMGRNYTWRLICKLFEYSHEKVDVGGDADFNDTHTEEFDDDDIKNLLGIKPNNKNDATPVLKDESDKFKTFNPDDPFAF